MKREEKDRKNKKIKNDKSKNETVKNETLANEINKNETVKNETESKNEKVKDKKVNVEIEKKSKEEKKIKKQKKTKEGKKQAKEEKKKIKAEKKQAKKEKKEANRFVQAMKRKWLIDGSRTLSLVLLILATFLGINTGMKVLDLTPIDLTQEKLYTLTDQSKERVKDIDKDVHIYFVGYPDDNADLLLAKQYKNANEKIVAEAVDAESRPDLVEKYGIEDTGSSGIIVECGDRSKVLTASDLVTYDSTTSQTISIAEEKLTSAIISVTTDDIPKVYFLEGYSDFTLSYNMYYLNAYLQNEITEVATLNILSTEKVPDDCDTLVITSPSQDFNDTTKTAIIDYINRGGNILWLNAAMAVSADLPNVNEVLALYGVNPFDVGVIRETTSSRMVANSPDLVIPNLGYSKITEDIYSDGIILANPTKININEDALEGLNVVETDLATTSEGAYFRTNFNNSSASPVDGEETGSFLVGAELEKTITDANEETGESAVTSTLIIYGENYFISDYPFTQDSQYAAIQVSTYNKDLVLNSLAYLSDREEDITARKSTGTVTYTATELQDTIVRIIIFAVPAIIILVGLIVWQKRRRKK